MAEYVAHFGSWQMSGDNRATIYCNSRLFFLHVIYNSVLFGNCIDSWYHQEFQFGLSSRLKNSLCSDTFEVDSHYTIRSLHRKG